MVGCHEAAGPERDISGKRLYDQHCARCHGSDGRGVAGQPPMLPDLSDPMVTPRWSDDQVRAAIRMGKPPGMPAFGNRFAEPSLKVLVTYVRMLSIGTMDAHTSAEGQ